MKVYMIILYFLIKGINIFGQEQFTNDNDSSLNKNKVALGIFIGGHYGDTRFSASPSGVVSLQTRIDKISIAAEYFYLPVHIQNNDYPVFVYERKEHTKGDNLRLSLLNISLGYNLISNLYLNIYYGIIIKESLGIGLNFHHELTDLLLFNINFRSFSYGWPIANSAAHTFLTNSILIGVSFSFN